MDRLGPIHIQFLRTLAGQDKHTHPAPANIKQDELTQMVREGLLIEYNDALQKRYTVTQLGSRLAQSYGDSPELEKIAVAYVMTKGYDKDSALKIVQENGAEMILRSKKSEETGGGTGQKGIAMQVEGGKPVFKPIKSL